MLEIAKNKNLVCMLINAVGLWGVNAFKEFQAGMMLKA